MIYQLEIIVANRVRPLKIAADQARLLDNGDLEFLTFEGKPVAHVSKRSLVSCEPSVTEPNSKEA